MFNSHLASLRTAANITARAGGALMLLTAWWKSGTNCESKVGSVSLGTLYCPLVGESESGEIADCFVDREAPGTYQESWEFASAHSIPLFRILRPTELATACAIAQSSSDSPSPFSVHEADKKRCFDRHS